MKLQLKESEKYHLAWSGGAGGKKIHVMQQAGEYMSFYPVCGSGVNSAGQTWKQESRHGLLLENIVESDRVCSKCLKSAYVIKEEAAK